MSDGPSKTSSRPTAQIIFERVREDARDELERTGPSLGFSALLAGFTMGATVLAYAAALVYVEGSSANLVAALLYPAGYISVILGRAQLFTENTLYPVVLTLEEPRYLGATARLWAIVLAANLVGALLFALVAVETSALDGAVRERIGELGAELVSRPGWTTFWSAVIAGWLLATVAWLVEATDSPLGSFFVIWLLTMVVGLTKLDHAVASAIEAWGAVLRGDVGFAPALGWQAVTVLGNALGGVFIVSLLNYGQVEPEQG